MTRLAWMLALALPLAGCPSEDDTTDDTDTDTEDTDTDVEGSRVDTILGLTGDTTEGGTIYTANCELCHSADGTGGLGSDLTATLPTLPEEDAVTIVIEGRLTMSAFGDDFSDQEIADVVAYIYAEFGS